jgi:hypothetical protein
MLVALEIYAGSHEPSEGIDHEEMPGNPSITFQCLDFMIVWEKLHRRAAASLSFLMIKYELG